MMRPLTRILLGLAPILLVLAVVRPAPAPAPEAFRPPEGSGEARTAERAEALFAEGSYYQAHAIFLELEQAGLSGDAARWNSFRAADSRWRAEQAQGNTVPVEQARKRLNELIRDLPMDAHDRVWAEIQESLADSWWMPKSSRNWHQAWQHYQQALEFWAGSDSIELARERYLAIVWKAARPRNVEPYYSYGYYGNFLPLPVLDNAIQIAATDADQAHAHYLAAISLSRTGGDWNSRRRVSREFEAALSSGAGTPWYDDALFHYAEWMRGNGRIVRRAGGNFTNEPDFVRALELYRRLTSEFSKGETRHYDQASNRIKNITGATLGLGISNVFLPGSEVQMHLSWRNLDRIDLSLYAVDLTKDVALAGSESIGWLRSIDASRIRPLRTWTEATEDDGTHRPGSRSIHLDDVPPPGAYVVVARGDGVEARDLLLISDASLVLKSTATQALVYFCDALAGAPIAGAEVTLWERFYNGTQWQWRDYEVLTDSDGLAVLPLSRAGDDYTGRELFVAASTVGRQAFATGQSYRHGGRTDSWRIHAYTDRPAYRPGDTVRWKLIARQYDGAVYSTPGGQEIEYEIQDPRGTKIESGEKTLNAYGSAWGEFALDASVPLGEFRVQFWTEGRATHIGSAVLYRVEEYKLPEFEVTVSTPEENGRRKSFRLGQTVEIEVSAAYYFGGPVADAEVELLVYQNPYYAWWTPRRSLSWYYEDLSPQYRPNWGGGQIVKRETLRTGEDGRVVLNLETPADARQDFEYRIEARVTDASRREITGGGTVRVTRQPYYVHPKPRHQLYRPGDRVIVDVNTVDANQQPIEATGSVTVIRDTWVEVWVDPRGREVRGAELERLRRKGAFPPEQSMTGWTLKFSGYEHEEILERTVNTDAEGKAEIEFETNREGYYRVSWLDERDIEALPVRGETHLWVADNSSRDLGYRHGGVQIIVDRDTFRTGDVAPVMLTVPTNDRYVLFAVEADDLYSYRLVHVTGTVKLLELPIDKRHVPNVFLSAVMVEDGQIHADSEQVIVPPAEQFLDVELSFDGGPYEPQQSGRLQVVTRDHEGRPVSAEVSLGLVDESIYAIQSDYAMDPRQFYYGTKRSLSVQTQSSFQYRRYTDLKLDDDGDLVEEREQLLGGSRAAGFEGQTMKDEMSRSRNLAAAPRRMDAKKSKMAESDSVVAQEAMAAVMPSTVAADQVVEAVQVRADFRATAFWQPDLVTDEDGRGEVSVRFPDSLTSWKATARVAGRESRFGIGTASARTRKPLIVRLQAPRFFVVGDQVTLSAVVNNNTEEALTVRPRLVAEGLIIDGSGSADAIHVPANGETRVDWRAEVVVAGEVKLQVSGVAGELSDAMELPFVAYEHGVEKFLYGSGKMKGDELTVQVDLPAARRAGSTTMTVQLSPSMAVTMLDALPYLADYPYGCTEQTMSRFLPAAITARTLRDLGVDPTTVKNRVFGGIEQEHAAATHGDGKKDLGELDRMVRRGLNRLYDFQHGDGGWGWWKEGESDHWMTAYVVWGLGLAAESGVDVRRGVIDRGLSFLDREIVEAELNPDLQAWMLHGLAASRGNRNPSKAQRAAFENLWSRRDELNAYTRSMLALSAHEMKDVERARTLLRNLENGVRIDRNPDRSNLQKGIAGSDTATPIAHWGKTAGYWRWSNGAIEATSFALRALLAIQPDHELIEPVTQWLIRNRRGAQWSNTRDTALVVLALNDYLRVSGEIEAELEYELEVNGKSVARRSILRGEALSSPTRIEVDPKLLRSGSNTIRVVRRSGEGPLYLSVESRLFSLEEPVTAAGNEIFVRRQYFERVGKETLLKGHIYEKKLLADEQTVTSGQRIEAVITIEAKNDYEYLLFEDLKPAGFEAAQVKSGSPLYAREIIEGDESGRRGRTVRVYQELRDRKVALFLDRLPQGVWEIRYELRAEVPGSFHALPVLGHAMYVPEIRCNGRESRVSVVD